ncbi:MAG: helix-turn-helix transcriptional regulator [Bacilli bacterium]|nr:helix-turn-helix transcriptional regulator [Bacilli bacterium]
MKTLKEFREAINKTQEEMAKELGISKSFYEKIESGARKPGRELLEKIKIAYPLIDINIFLNLNHTNCSK